MFKSGNGKVEIITANPHVSKIDKLIAFVLIAVSAVAGLMISLVLLPLMLITGLVLALRVKWLLKKAYTTNETADKETAKKKTVFIYENSAH